MKKLMALVFVGTAVAAAAAPAASGEVKVQNRPVVGAAIPTSRFEWSSWWAKPGYWQRRIDDARGDIASGNGEFDIVFCGDSNTQNWEGWRAKEDIDNLRKCIAEGRITEDRAFIEPRQTWLDLKKKYRVLNLGISGDCTQHLLWRLTKGGLLEGYRAKYVCVLIGANNCYGKDDTAKPENIIEGIKAIIAAIREKQPQAKILLHKCTPTSRKPDNLAEIRHERVNEMIPSLADGKRVILCDFTPQLKNADGSQNKKLFADGLHLNEDGFRIWSAAVQAAMAALR